MASVNGERTSAFNTRQKLRPCAAAGRAAARRAVLCARGVRSKHDAEAPRLVAARRSVEMIKLAGGAFRRLLEARLTYSSPKVRARRSCTIPRCPQLRSPHVHRERASQNPHATSMQNVGFNFFEADVYSSHTSECARRLGLACWSSSSCGTTTPRCLTSGPAPPMGAWGTHLSGAPAEAARPGACQELLCGGFGAHYCVLFDAGPLRPMHGRSGAAVRACFDCKPSVGTPTSIE